MSKEAKEVKEGAEPTAKKKGKLPVIIVLVALIAGGGFFGMKMKSGGGGPKKVVIKAAPEAIALDKEFLVNLSNGANTYLRAEIAFEVRDGFKKEDLDANMPAIRDAINQIFRSKSLQEVSASQTANLQKEIAEAVNAILIGHMKDEDKKAQADFEKAAKDAQSAEKPKDDGKKDDASKDDASKDDAETFICPAGPVLNVYFTSFTTQ
ncbi:MAG TPA: flagellar basal body-associated FliL family protein [Fimbriimonadaceae bacterium]|nr:flagellar basal body-associated FliL family protein [Fimbriimonadaceae bacterium]